MKGKWQVTEKPLGADAAAVDTAEPVASDAASHAAHTPGPWHIGEMGGNSGNAEAISVRDGADFVIADVWLDTARLLSEGPANAHLIAAAPEMRVGCDRALTILRYIRDSEPEAWYRILLTSPAADVWDSLKAAIAKAEGKQP